MTEKMTAQALWDLYVNEEIESVDESIEQDDYGCNIHEVFKLEDGRFFQIYYYRDGQGNYNSWRDGDATDPEEVEPYEVTTTAYRKK